MCTGLRPDLSGCEKPWLRNLDVIWQTTGSRRSLLLGGVTCSEGHFREVGLAACRGCNQGERNWRQESTKNSFTISNKKNLDSGKGCRDGDEAVKAAAEVENSCNFLS